MLLPMSSCVCIPFLRLSLLGLILPKYQFCTFLVPDMNTYIGVVMYMYLKHFPDYIDSRIFGFVGLTTSVQNIC